MKRCNCCNTALPDTAGRLICPPCFQSLRIHSFIRTVCTLHTRIVATNELEASRG